MYVGVCLVCLGGTCVSMYGVYICSMVCSMCMCENVCSVLCILNWATDKYMLCMFSVHICDLVCELCVFGVYMVYGCVCVFDVLWYV